MMLLLLPRLTPLPRLPSSSVPDRSVPMSLPSSKLPVEELSVSTPLPRLPEMIFPSPARGSADCVRGCRCPAVFRPLGYPVHADHWPWCRSGSPQSGSPWLPDANSIPFCRFADTILPAAASARR